MKAQKKQTDQLINLDAVISDEKLLEIFEEYEIRAKELKFGWISHRFKSHGTWELSCEINDEVYSTLTHNSSMIEEWNEDGWDWSSRNGDPWYESAEEARLAGLDEILHSNAEEIKWDLENADAMS